ncbi:MAG: hypothetical protein IPJ11_16380, partial [Gemmatimonadetes bacterium]|nr:hypothetical protein [Gemmatimonadota bacterium]
SFIGTLDGETHPEAGPRILGVRPFGRMSAAAVVRFGSGLPYTRTNVTGDSIIGDINGSRLPNQFTLDLPSAGRCASAGWQAVSI